MLGNLQKIEWPMGFENDINAFWGTQWIENSKGIDITSHLSQFKFRYFLKPILDQLKPNAKVCEVGSGNCVNGSHSYDHIEPISIYMVLT